MRFGSGSGRHKGDPTTVAVLGVGNIGAVHLRSALAMDGVEVVAVADALEENRSRARKRGVPTAYDDFVTLLEAETPDVAVVALPPFLHREAVERAAAEGIDVFVEKPFARSTDEADAMIEAATAAGITVGVDHTLRYQPDMIGVKEAYEAGTVGRVPYATMRRINDFPLGRPPVERSPPSWPFDTDAVGGGTLFELGIHVFDVLEWLFGPVEPKAATIDSTLEIPVEDSATVLLQAPETGTAITVHCGSYQWEDVPDMNTSLRLEGITDTIESEHYVPDNFYASAARSAIGNVANRVTGGEPTVYGPTFYLQAHYNALREFLEAVDRGEEPPVTGKQGRRCVALVERSYELARADDGAGDGIAGGGVGAKPMQPMAVRRGSDVKQEGETESEAESKTESEPEAPQ